MTPACLHDIHFGPRTMQHAMQTRSCSLPYSCIVTLCLYVFVYKHMFYTMRDFPCVVGNLGLNPIRLKPWVVAAVSGAGVGLSVAHLVRPEPLQHCAHPSLAQPHMMQTEKP